MKTAGLIYKLTITTTIIYKQLYNKKETSPKWLIINIRRGNTDILPFLSELFLVTVSQRRLVSETATVWQGY